MLPPSIRQPADLVTPHEAIREGFLKQALAKTHKADPYVAEAFELQAALVEANDIRSLATITVTTIQGALLAAAGFSDKARGRLSDIELQSALVQVLETIQQKSGASWREEVLFRFLLTRGDALGGSIRNYTGSLGGVHLTEAIIDALGKRAVTLDETRVTKKGKVSSLRWGNRLLLFDIKPRGMDKNVDAVLLDLTDLPVSRRLMYSLSDIVACGELKGGSHLRRISPCPNK